MRVEPIRELKDVRAIKRMLAVSPRDHALFVIGINTNLRASDLLSLTVGHIRDLPVGGEIVLTEKKTGKPRRITANSEIVDAATRLLKHRQSTGEMLTDDAPLFVGQRGRLTVPTFSRMVKQWCGSVNLRGNYASHSLRKTFGYHQRVRLNTSIPELMVMFNHSSQRQTLDYLGVQQEEIRDAYLKLSY
ncbi:tyrosine-type recombinase/integrase [Desulfopila aestuarii]|uniref:Phage integrase family protein n=1 Tax=Desulfopila aestuarii DSM 18488 TaxID=1121416 RepID=A0A1M7YK39_9BACT|nr:tyrosine-type recombinase/integrase [Desulfopila aestuarii]SHO52990.1 Phage integrase family protein [Desulfopila aestuarii DSM 18488]